MPTPDNLQRHGEAFTGKATGHARGWLAGQVKGKGEVQAIEHRGGRFALDGAWSALDRPRSQWHLGRQEQVIALEEAPCLFVEHCTCQLRLAMLHPGNTLSCFNHLDEAGFEPLGPLRVAV